MDPPKNDCLCVLVLYQFADMPAPLLRPIAVTQSFDDAFAIFDNILAQNYLKAKYVVSFSFESGWRPLSEHHFTEEPTAILGMVKTFDKSLRKALAIALNHYTSVLLYARHCGVDEWALRQKIVSPLVVPTCGIRAVTLAPDAVIAGAGCAGEQPSEPGLSGTA